MISVQELFMSTMFVTFTLCVASTNSLPQPNLANALRSNGHLALYPRVGKRYTIPRRDFLNILADKWQRTGSLRGAIREIQDMTEKKRSLDTDTASTYYEEERKFSPSNRPPPFILLVRRDVDVGGFVQPQDETYGDFFFRYPAMRRRNYY